MDQEKSSSVVADGAVDLEELRRVRFPHLAAEYMPDVARFAARNRIDVWNHVAAEVRMENGHLRLVLMVTFAGLLAKAEETGKYSHVGKAKWKRDAEGKPVRVRLPVYRLVAGRARACWVQAKWSNYYPGPGFWDKWDEHMLWKCCVAIGLRLAIPDLGNLLTVEEMAQYLASSPAPKPADPPFKDEDLPRSPQGLKLWMLDYGIRDEEKRNGIITHFRQTWKCTEENPSPMFFAEVAKAIARNPSEYGGCPPTAA